LARKLAAHGEVDEIDALLDFLEQENLLSNARFVDMFAQARAGKHGSLRLKFDLRQKGVIDADMTQALESARTQDLDAARLVWQKKFGELAHDAAGKSRQYRFLASRGFPSDVIQCVLSGDNLEDA
jgi:regulatory protein